MPPSRDVSQPDGAIPPPLPPSVEEAYRKKCIELRRRMNEVEEHNDAVRLRKARLLRGIRKMRLERAMILHQLSKRMRKNGMNGSFDDDSDGSSDAPPTPEEKPLRIKRPHRRPIAPALLPANSRTSQTSATSNNQASSTTHHVPIAPNHSPASKLAPPINSHDIVRAPLPPFPSITDGANPYQRPAAPIDQFTTKMMSFIRENPQMHPASGIVNGDIQGYCHNIWKTLDEAERGSWETLYEAQMQEWTSLEDNRKKDEARAKKEAKEREKLKVIKDEDTPMDDVNGQIDQEVALPWQ